MKEIITNGLMTFGAGFATASITKAQGPGRALDDIMTLVGFEKLHEVAEMKRTKRDFNIQSYKESIAQKIASVPEGNLQEPPLSIVGPALEASKYYIEEKTLREMFSNLIASSMNVEKDNLVHPSFVEIIKQINPHDGLMLQRIKKNQLPVQSPYPIMNMVLNTNESGKKTVIPLIVYFEDLLTWNQNAPSVNNLERLGILKTSFESYLTNEKRYDFIRNNIQLKKHLDNNNDLKLNKGLLTLTNLGENFINICVE